MADWKTLVVDAILADGKIDDDEIKVLRKHLYEDGKIDKNEVEFLIELRNKAQKKAGGAPVNPKFETFFFKAISDNVLADGKIDGSEANWLRKMLFADGKIDPGEKRFMQNLKKNAKATSPAFDKLYAETVGK
jgi:uncharacterized tellurite resistance protein B-like protein